MSKKRATSLKSPGGFLNTSEMKYRFIKEQLPFQGEEYGHDIKGTDIHMEKATLKDFVPRKVRAFSQTS